MSGRETFSRVGFILTPMIFLLRLLPRAVRVFLWDVAKPFSQLPFIGLRYVLLKSMVGRCGNNVRVGSNVTILSWDKISLGNNISIHDFCYIDAAGTLEIQDNVSIAHNSSILTTNHDWQNLLIPIKYNPVTFAKVVIEEDVWVGCGCRILAGVTVQSRSIIAAGAVVNKHIVGRKIYGGVPARPIKDI